MAPYTFRAATDGSRHDVAHRQWRGGTDRERACATSGVPISLPPPGLIPKQPTPFGCSPGCDPIIALNEQHLRRLIGDYIHY